MSNYSDISEDSEFSYLDKDLCLVSDDLATKLTNESKKLKMKVLYDSSTPLSYTWKHSSGQFEIVKFDKENTKRKKILLKLRAITEYVDLELGNVPEELKFDEDQVVYIMWKPTENQVMGYLSAETFRECYKFENYNEGVIVVQSTPILKLVLGVTRLWFLRGKGYRKMNVLSCLLEACRKTYTKGEFIAKTELAFISLTNDIIYFLDQYLGNTDEVFIVFPKMNNIGM